MVCARDRRPLGTATGRSLQLGVTLVCGVLGLGVALETVLAVSEATSSPEPPRRDVAPQEAAAPIGAPPSVLVQLIMERPLFSPGRRAPSPQAAAPPAAVVEAPPPEWNWRLAGLMVGPDRREALFARGSDKRVVPEGEAIDGWTLAAVRPNGVTLAGRGGERTLSPERQTPRETNARIIAGEAERNSEKKRADAFLMEATQRLMAAGGGDTGKRRSGR
jgi:hypothetical protein